MGTPDTRKVADGDIVVEGLESVRTAELTRLLVHVVGIARAS